MLSIVDGQEYGTPIVTLDITNGEITVGVDTIADHQDVVAIEYYDMNGVKIQHPGKGLYICKTTLTNGSTKTNKIIRK